MEAEKSKHRQYGDAVRNGPHKLLPLVFETYGACGPELHRHLEAIREEEAWLDKHGLRGDTRDAREAIAPVQEGPIHCAITCELLAPTIRCDKCLWHRQLY